MKLVILGIEEILNRSARLEAAADDLEKPTKEAGIYMLGSIERNFEAEGRPKWQALAPSTLESKSGSEILVESGGLKEDATSPDSLEISGSGFTISTNDPKAKFHQFGTRRMTARKLFLFPDEDRVEISDIFNQHFEQAL